jgi:hypothetical protein
VRKRGKRQKEVKGEEDSRERRRGEKEEEGETTKRRRKRRKTKDGHKDRLTRDKGEVGGDGAMARGLLAIEQVGFLGRLVVHFTARRKEGGRRRERRKRQRKKIIK